MTRILALLTLSLALASCGSNVPLDQTPAAATQQEAANKAADEL